MKPVAFQVQKFRNIVDSGRVKLDPNVTCLVGKNEAGKSGLLEALYLINPAYNESANVEDQYPRWLVAKDRRLGELSEHAFCSVDFDLEPSDIAVIDTVLGPGVLKAGKLTLSRNYGGSLIWSFGWSEKAAIDHLRASLPGDLGQRTTSCATLDALKTELDRLSELDDTKDDARAVIEAGKRHVAGSIHDGGVWRHVVELLSPRVPRFFRFTSYSTLDGRIDLRRLAESPPGGPARDGLETARALLALAGTDLDQLKNDDYELRKSELEAVQIDLTSQVFEYWTQNPHLEVLIDVDKETVRQGNGTTAVARFLDIRLRDRRTGYSNNFRQRSSGFQWFFSFLAAFSQFEGESAPIVLLDEPALTLHGKAQADFLRFIDERLAPDTSVVYTTHSPFMVAPSALDRVRIVEDRGVPGGAVCTDEVLTADPDSLFPLQAALGYDIAQSLFVGPNNLVVEGTSDFIYLTVMSLICGTAGRSTLDERWRILPAGGASNIPTFVSLIGPHLDITVLVDSDTKGMQRISNMVDRGLLKQSRLVFASCASSSRKADIEDIFSEGDYLKLYNKTFTSKLKVASLPPGDRITKRIEALNGKPYDHGKVAETLLRGHHEFTMTDTSLDGFATLVEELNATMGA